MNAMQIFIQKCFPNFTVSEYTVFDEDGNSQSVDLDAIEQSTANEVARIIAAFASNKNCRGCHNCTDCTDCRDCDHCSNCSICIECNYCNNCACSVDCNGCYDIRRAYHYDDNTAR